MQRVLEPELMDDEVQALAYASADFSEPNAAFVGHFLAVFTDFSAGHIVDLGCGPGDIAIRLARTNPALQVTGVDGAEAMLARAESARLQADDVSARIHFELGCLPAAPQASGFDAVVSNSLLHHLPDPAVLWETAKRAGQPGAPLMVMDLVRPATPEAAQALVDHYAADAPEVLRLDYYNSLLAAFEVGEVREQLAQAGLHEVAVHMTSDRHWLASGRLPA